MKGIFNKEKMCAEVYERILALTRDGPAGVALEIPGLEGKPWGFVAGTRVGRT